MVEVSVGVPVASGVGEEVDSTVGVSVGATVTSGVGVSVDVSVALGVGEGVGSGACAITGAETNVFSKITAINKTRIANSFRSWNANMVSPRFCRQPGTCP